MRHVYQPQVAYGCVYTGVVGGAAAAAENDAEALAEADEEADCLTTVG